MENYTKEFISEAFDLNQRQKNLEELERNLEMYKSLQESFNNLPRSKRRKLIKNSSFSKNLKNNYKKKVLEEINQSL